MDDSELNVRRIMLIHGYCCARESESDAECITVTAFTTVRFKRSAIEEKDRFIRAALSQLPEEFRAPEGASILGASVNRNYKAWVSGKSWRPTIDALVQLGIAAGMAELYPPRVMGGPRFLHVDPSAVT